MGDCPPIADELLSAYPQRWVRFHSLPKSKRYAHTEAEYAILLGRYNTVLDELFTDQDVYVITPNWTVGPTLGARPAEQEQWQPGSRLWLSICTDDSEPGEEVYTHLYLSQIHTATNGTGCVNATPDGCPRTPGACDANQNW